MRIKPVATDFDNQKTLGGLAFSSYLNLGDDTLLKTTAADCSTQLEFYSTQVANNQIQIDRLPWLKSAFSPGGQRFRFQSARLPEWYLPPCFQGIAANVPGRGGKSRSLSSVGPMNDADAGGCLPFNQCRQASPFWRQPIGVKRDLPVEITARGGMQTQICAASDLSSPAQTCA